MRRTKRCLIILLLSVLSASLLSTNVTAISKDVYKRQAYAEYKKANQSEIYGGDPVIIYGKDALYKTGKELLPVSDSTDPSLYPSSAVNQQINYIGGSRWQMAGSVSYTHLSGNIFRNGR